MFSGRYSPLLVDDSGQFFIDRDPIPFKHILNFLRTGFIPPETDMPRNSPEWQILMLEVEHWGITSWQEALLAKEVVTKLKIDACSSLAEVLECITKSEDGVHMLKQLAEVHEICYKNDYGSKLLAPIEEVILSIMDCILERKSPVGTLKNLKDVIKDLYSAKKLDSQAIAALRVVRASLKHDPKWYEVVKDIPCSVSLVTGINGVISEEGRKFTKTGSTLWNCGVLGQDEIPAEGTTEWTVKLGANCNNLMVGIASGQGFNKTASNYSNSKGWYFYCYNGTLYSRNGNGSSWAGGPGTTNTPGTKIKVTVDMDKKTMSFAINGLDKGVAFRDIELLNGSPLYPAFDAYEANCTFEILDDYK